MVFDHSDVPESWASLVPRADYRRMGEEAEIRGLFLRRIFQTCHVTLGSDPSACPHQILAAIESGDITDGIPVAK